MAPLTPWLWPSSPSYRVHVDYAYDENGRYLVLVDAHSRWPEIYFMRQNTSATTTIAILRELFAKYELPVHCKMVLNFEARNLRILWKSMASNTYVLLLIMQLVMSRENGWFIHSRTTWRPAKVVNCRFSNVLPTTCWPTGQQGILPLAEQLMAYSWDKSYISV